MELRKTRQLVEFNFIWAVQCIGTPRSNSKLHIDRLILKISRLASLFTLGAVQTGSYLIEEDGGAGRGALEQEYFFHSIWLVRPQGKTKTLGATKSKWVYRYAICCKAFNLGPAIVHIKFFQLVWQLFSYR